MANERVRRLEGKLRDGKVKYQKAYDKALKLEGKQYRVKGVAIQRVAKG